MLLEHTVQWIIIFKSKRLRGEWHIGFPQNIVPEVLDNRWINAELLLEWGKWFVKKLTPQALGLMGCFLWTKQNNMSSGVGTQKPDMALECSILEWNKKQRSRQTDMTRHSFQIINVCIGRPRLWPSRSTKNPIDANITGPCTFLAVFFFISLHLEQQISHQLWSIPWIFSKYHRGIYKKSKHSTHRLAN